MLDRMPIVLALACLCLLAPTAFADGAADADDAPDASDVRGECVEIDPTTTPPSITIDPTCDIEKS